METIARFRRIPRYLLSKRLMSTDDYQQKLRRSYEILNVDEQCDREQVREAYLRLAKDYHPDSGSPRADVKKFQQLEAAFRIINEDKLRKSRESKEGERPPEVQQFDIKHTAPQHRQYLSYEGTGFGTPSQRERMWAKKRASDAAQNVMEHRLSKANAGETSLIDKNAPKKAKHDIKTKYGFDRLVEDLIQEAMSKGEFDNLPGKGKPLSSHQNTNPYVDFVTHKMNQVLIDNGFTPAWITLQKEITREVATLRSDLIMERAQFGPAPLLNEENELWIERFYKYESLVKKINSKIIHYNLVVPILQKQMIFISLEKEAANALKEGKDRTQMAVNVKKVNINRKTSTNNDNIFYFIKSMFNKSDK